MKWLLRVVVLVAFAFAPPALADEGVLERLEICLGEQFEARVQFQRLFDPFYRVEEMAVKYRKSLEADVRIKCYTNALKECAGQTACLTAFKSKLTQDFESKVAKVDTFVRSGDLNEINPVALSNFRASQEMTVSATPCDLLPGEAGPQPTSELSCSAVRLFGFLVGFWDVPESLLKPAFRS